MGRKKRKTAVMILTVLAVIAVCCSVIVFAYDGKIDQQTDHSQEESMYLYTLDIFLENPCNTNDMDDDSVNEFWFDFSYKDQNGYGKNAVYRLDMSRSGGRNLNGELLKKTFLRGNDDGCGTEMSVWVPGIVNKVSIHLNMDGGERLSFTVNGIFLNGFRVNTGTDYVSSAYYDSDAEIPCYVPDAAITGSGTDQYHGIFTDTNRKAAEDRAVQGDFGLYYHNIREKEE